MSEISDDELSTVAMLFELTGWPEGVITEMASSMAKAKPPEPGQLVPAGMLYAVVCRMVKAEAQVARIVAMRDSLGGLFPEIETRITEALEES